jgi:hypothetical protein
MRFAPFPLMSRFVRILTAVAVAAGPVADAAAGEGFYFRHVGPEHVIVPEGPSSGPVGNYVDGTGRVPVQAPLQVRARLTLPFSLNLKSPTAVSWRSVGGALPPGIGLDGNGVLSGVPGALGTYQKIQVEVTDSEGRTGTSRPMVLDVRPLPTILMSIPGGNLDSGQKAFIYPSVAEAYGDKVWSLAGNLPTGLSFNVKDGTITGYPEVPGTYPGIAVSVRDGDGATGTTPPFAFTVTSTLAVAGYGDMALARVGRPFVSKAPVATGNLGKVTWSLADASAPLPKGLKLDADTGVVSGTPVEQARNARIIVRAEDTRNNARSGATFVLNTLGDPSLGVSQTSYGARAGEPFSIAAKPANVLGAPSWSLVGSLPVGVALGADGSLGGIPQYPGEASGLRLRVVDLFDGLQAVSDPITLAIFPKLSVQGATVPSASVGKPYVIMPPTVAGARGTVGWSVQGSLPDGLALDPADGAIRGTPKAAGSFGGIAFVARDSYDGASAPSPAFPITVAPAPAPGTVQAFSLVPIPTPLLATVTRPFDYQPRFDGGVEPIRWQIAGALPGWLGFDPDTGRLKGTPDAASTVSGLRITARDARNVPATGNAFGIVTEPLGALSVSVADSSAAPGVPFSGPAPFVQNNVGAVAYDLAPGSGALPHGTQLVRATGVIAGTPDTTGDHGNIAVTATDASGAVATSPRFRISVVPVPGSANVAMASMNPNVTGAVNLRMEAAPSATGLGAGTAWSLAPGSAPLPAWASLVEATGLVSGVPPALGTYPDIVLQVADAAGHRARTNPFSISILNKVVLEAGAGTKDGTPATDAGNGTGTGTGSAGAGKASVVGTVGEYLTSFPSLSGAQGQTVWTLASGTLPDGLRLNAASGAIYGTPTTPGLSADLSLHVRDSMDNTASTGAFAIRILPLPLRVTPPATLSMNLDRSYSGSFTATGGTGRTTWSALTSLPPGLTLSTAGVLSGTPTRTGQFTNVQVQVADAAMAVGASRPLTITVTPPAPPITFAATVEPAYQAEYGVPFATQPPGVVGAKGTLTFSIASGTKPGWATLDSATGILSGTPTDIVQREGLTLLVTDGTQSVTTAPFAISTSRKPFSVSGPGSVPAARIGDDYATGRPTALNPVGKVTWTSNALPEGLALDAATGIVSGSPRTKGTYPGITLTATDEASTTGSATSFSITVMPAPAFVGFPTSFYGRANTLFSGRPITEGLIGSQAWKIASGTKPSWAVFNPSTGEFTGTPPAVATSAAMTLSVTDGTKRTITSPSFTLAVSGNLAVASSKTSWVARVGTLLNATSTFSGNAGPLEWSLGQGSLPPTLAVDKVSGAVTGTPTEPGVYIVALKAVDRDGSAKETVPFTINAYAAPVATMADQTVRATAPFSFKPGLNLARGTVSWKATAGTALPAWAPLTAATGAIAGNGGAVGITTGHRLTVTDGEGATGDTQPFSITVTPGIAISGIDPSGYTVRLNEAMVPFSPTVSNAINPPNWTRSSGSLPAGVVYVPANNTFSGTATAAGTYTSVWKATDPADGANASVTVKVTVVADIAVTGDLGVKVHVLKDFATARPGVSGQRTADLRWDLAAGTLPDWARLDHATGIVSGRAPEGAGTVTGLALRVTDPADGFTGVSGSFSIQVLPTPEVIGMATAYLARFGTPYASAAPTALNVGTVTWSWAAGQSPPTWAKVDPATGRIVGTPDSVGTAMSLRIQATDDFAGTALSVPFSLKVVSEPTAEVRQPSWLHRVGDAVSVAPISGGVAGATSWTMTVSDGALPEGLGFDAATGVVSGTARGVGSITYALTLTDSLAADGGSTAQTRPVTLTVSPTLAMSGLGDSYTGHVGVAFSTDRPQVTGNVLPLTYALTVAAPPGMNFSATTGILDGLPSAPRAETVAEIVATDPLDGRTVRMSTKLRITERGSVKGVYDVTAPAGSEIAGSSFTPTLTYQIGTLRWELATGLLPTGVTVEGATGRLVGSTNAQGTTSGLSIRAVDADGSVSTTSGTFRLIVGAPSAIAAIPAQNWRVGRPVEVKLTVANVSTNDLPKWSAVPGTFPAGIDVTPQGFVRGIPQEAGAYQGQVALTDAGGKQILRGVSVTVRSPLELSYPTPNQAAINEVVDYRPSVLWSDGTLTYALVETRGSLPSGVTFKSSGSIGGTVGNAAIWGGTVQVTDSVDGATATFPLTLSTTNAFTVSSMPARTVRAGTEYAWQPPAVANPPGTVAWSRSSGAFPNGMAIDAATGVVSGTPRAASSGSYVIRATAGEVWKEVSVPWTVRGALSVSAQTDITLSPNATYGMQNVSNYQGFGSAQNLLGSVTLSMVAAGYEDAFPNRQYRTSYQNYECTGGTYQYWQNGSYQSTCQGWGYVTRYNYYTDPTQLMLQGAFKPGVMTGLVLKAVDSSDGAVAYSNPFDIYFVLATGPSTQYLRTNLPYNGPAPLAQGFPGAVTWSINGTKPAGLDIDPATGILSGRPTQAGTFTVTLVAQSGTASATTSYQMVIKGAMTFPAVADVTLLAGKVYGNGGTSVTVGPVGGGTESPLPSANLSVNRTFANLALVQGTAAAGRLQFVGTPTAQVVRDVVVSATDPADGSTVQSNPFNVYVVSVTAPPNARLRRGADFTGQAPSAQGFPGPETWSATGLPPGMRIDPVTGVVSGNPTETGVFNVVLKASATTLLPSGTASQTATYSLSVNEPLAMAAQPDLTVTAGSAYAAVNRPFSQVTAAVSNATGSVAYASTPIGTLSVVPRRTYNTNGSESTSYASGMISGTAALGTFPGTVITATDPWDGTSVSSNPFTLYVVSIDPMPDVVARIGTRFETAPPVPKGFPGGIVWSSDTTLPANTVLDPVTGVLSGSPSAAATTKVTLRATSGTATFTRSYGVVVNDFLAFPPVPDQTIEATLVYGSSRRVTLATIPARQQSFNFTTTGNLGTLGVATYSNDTVILNGKSDVETYPGVRLTATDTYDGSNVTSNPFTVYVVRIVPPAPQKLRVGTYATVPAPTPTGFPGPIAWNVDSGLPEGMQLQADGSLSGTPMKDLNANIVLRATSGTASFTTTYAIDVATKLGWPRIPDQTFLTGQAYSATLTAPTGFRNNPTYATSAILAPYGIPTAAASAPTLQGTSPTPITVPGIVVRATDPFDGTAFDSTPFNLYVVDMQVPADQKLRIGTEYVGPEPKADGFPARVTWTSTLLPDNLYLDPVTGVVRGTPTTATTASTKTVTLTATARTEAGNVASISKSYAIEVRAALSWATPTLPDVSLQSDVANAPNLTAVTGVQTAVTFASSTALSPLVLSTSGNSPRLTGRPVDGTPILGVVLTATDSWDGVSIASNPFNVYAVDLTYPGTVYGRLKSPLAMAAPSTKGFPGTPRFELVTASVPQNGLQFNGATGAVELTPTVADTRTITVKATAGTATIQKSFSLVVSPELAVTTGAEAIAFRRDVSPTTVAAFAGLKGTAGWSATPSIAPFSIETSGAAVNLKGTPATAMAYPNVVLSLRDSLDGATASSPPISLYAVDLKAGTIPTFKMGVEAFGGDATANGYPTEVTWSASPSTPLQAGLFVNPVTGAIYGKPTASGAKPVTLQVTWGASVIPLPSVTVTVQP